MSITVHIGNSSLPLEEVDQHWITQQINLRRQDGIDQICVKVSIDEPGINLNLTSKACGGGAGGRPPNPDEKELIELWKKRRLDELEIKPGQLVAFINELKRSL